MAYQSLLIYLLIVSYLTLFHSHHHHSQYSNVPSMDGLFSLNLLARGLEMRDTCWDAHRASQTAAGTPTVVGSFDGALVAVHNCLDLLSLLQIKLRLGDRATESCATLAMSHRGTQHIVVSHCTSWRWKLLLLLLLGVLAVLLNCPHEFGVLRLNCLSCYSTLGYAINDITWVIVFSRDCARYVLWIFHGTTRLLHHL